MIDLDELKRNNLIRFANVVNGAKSMLGPI